MKRQYFENKNNDHVNPISWVWWKRLLVYGVVFYCSDSFVRVMIIILIIIIVIVILLIVVPYIPPPSVRLESFMTCGSFMFSMLI